MKTIKVPARLPVSRKSPVIKKEIENEWGGSFKIILRNNAKKIPVYYTPLDNGGVNGVTDTGKEIKINTLGKWLFGTPGYAGHIIAFATSNEVKVYLPSASPEEAFSLIEEALKLITSTRGENESK